MKKDARCCTSIVVFLAAAWLLVQSISGQVQHSQEMTPLLLSVHDAPVPFRGSDGRVHLVYELWMTNFSSGEVVVSEVEVLGDGVVLQTIDSAEVNQRLQPAGQREGSGTLSKSTEALLFLHISLAPGAALPMELTHRVKAHVGAAPPGQQDRVESGGNTKLDRLSVVRIGPPLTGNGYISADSCCDAARHTRAALAVNGRAYVAQRYAVDWEQLDANGRIYSGPPLKLESYTIFGKPVFAVADATVAMVTKGLAEQVPGTFPTNISVAEADGNSIILDLGQHRYAMYAHLQSESIHLKAGDKVRLGDVIARVGNSGNSVAPHLHFQVMTTEASLSSNGLPYAISNFTLTGKSSGTKAFDEAEANGTVLAVTRASFPVHVQDAMPLDQLIVSFAPAH